jgi:hypothetical protein
MLIFLIVLQCIGMYLSIVCGTIVVVKIVYESTIHSIFISALGIGVVLFVLRWLVM